MPSLALCESQNAGPRARNKRTVALAVDAVAAASIVVFYVMRYDSTTPPDLNGCRLGRGKMRGTDVLTAVGPGRARRRGCSELLYSKILYLAMDSPVHTFSEQ